MHWKNAGRLPHNQNTESEESKTAVFKRNNKYIYIYSIYACILSKTDLLTFTDMISNMVPPSLRWAPVRRQRPGSTRRCAACRPPEDGTVSCIGSWRLWVQTMSSRRSVKVNYIPRIPTTIWGMVFNEQPLFDTTKTSSSKFPPGYVRWTHLVTRSFCIFFRRILMNTSIWLPQESFQQDLLCIS